MKKDERESAPGDRNTARQPDRPEVELPEEDTNLSAYAVETGLFHAHDPSREFHAGKRAGDPRGPAGGGDPFLPMKGPPSPTVPGGFVLTFDPESGVTGDPDVLGPRDPAVTEIDTAHDLRMSESEAAGDADDEDEDDDEEGGDEISETDDLRPEPAIPADAGNRNPP